MKLFLDALVEVLVNGSDETWRNFALLLGIAVGVVFWIPLAIALLIIGAVTT